MLGEDVNRKSTQEIFAIHKYIYTTMRYSCMRMSILILINAELATRASHAGMFTASLDVLPHKYRGSVCSLSATLKAPKPALQFTLQCPLKPTNAPCGVARHTHSSAQTPQAAPALKTADKIHSADKVLQLWLAWSSAGDTHGG